LKPGLQPGLELQSNASLPLPGLRNNAALRPLAKHALLIPSRWRYRLGSPMAPRELRAAGAGPDQAEIIQRG
jgi:hypothetical protein